MYFIAIAPFMVAGCVAFYFRVLCPRNDKTADQQLDAELNQTKHYELN